MDILPLKFFITEESNTDHDNTVAREIMHLAETGTGTARAKNLLKAFNINHADIIKVEHLKGKNIRRPLTNKPKNVSDDIADITIVVKTPEGKRAYPISIKDPAGSTFGNFGIAGSFDLDEKGNVIINPHDSDYFLKVMGVSKEKARRGLQKYIDKGVEPEQGTVNTDIDEHPEYNSNMLQRYLMAGYGYGYWYAREWANDSWEVIDLRTFKKLAKYVGKPKVDFISYPGDTKQLHIMLHTSTNHKYNVDIRNSKGGDIPKEIKVRITTS